MLATASKFSVLFCSLTATLVSSIARAIVEIRCGHYSRHGVWPKRIIKKKTPIQKILSYAIFFLNRKGKRVRKVRYLNLMCTEFYVSRWIDVACVYLKWKLSRFPLISFLLCTLFGARNSPGKIIMNKEAATTATNKTKTKQKNSRTHTHRMCKYSITLTHGFELKGAKYYLNGPIQTFVRTSKGRTNQ